MSESKARKARQQKFLSENPRCYFCGGLNEATTIDHVPPRACFPDTHFPEGFEFPACKRCNEGAAKHDLIFGFYSMLVDFDEIKTGQQPYEDKKRRLLSGILNNYPDAVPKPQTAEPVFRSGSIFTPAPMGFAVSSTPAMKEAMEVMGDKLTHALYYRETGRILTSDHEFFRGIYQPQLDGTQSLTEFLTGLLPDITIGGRQNIKEYGDNFRYLSGYKEHEDFFIYAAQFGHGMIIWGIVCGPNVEHPTAGNLGGSRWHKGACGEGANVAHSDKTFVTTE